MEYKQGEQIKTVADSDNCFVTVAKDYLMTLEQKAKDAEYLRGRADGMEYVIDSIVEAFEGKESE